MAGAAVITALTRGPRRGLREQMARVAARLAVLLLLAVPARPFATSGLAGARPCTGEPAGGPGGFHMSRRRSCRARARVGADGAGVGPVPAGPPEAGAAPPGPAAPAAPSRVFYDSHQEAVESAAGDWLEVDFTRCLGRGGYGDVYEAAITCGPLQGARAVAKRALTRRAGKMKWQKGQWDSISGEASATRAVAEMTWTTYYDVNTRPAPRATGSLLATTAFYSSAAASSCSDTTLSDAEEGTTEAAEYLEVEDYVNRLVAVNCPDIAAPYVGDAHVAGTRWLVWLFAVQSSL